ncbi:MAG: hydantoinase B/oxoprolinase family protein [Candidatus Eiseniibacteriota bacterium]|nr:MAG: hydantoinase B/oxoprolinase family protein [Candidatus Eisenbacteria bacterium]
MSGISLAELDVCHNLLRSVAEEMGVSLMRTSFSPNIKERRDFSCAVFDGAGRMVVQGEHLPVHLGSMPLSVRAVLEAMELREGDTAILNDPYQGGTHLPDMTLVSPVCEGRAMRPLLYVANRAHHADVGGMTPGSMPVSEDIFQEGLRIPPVLLARRGRIQTDVMRLLLANVRTPREREGDLLAQLAANELGRRRLLELVHSRGRGWILQACSALQVYAERIMRELIRSMKTGRYSFTDFLDDDGVTDDPVRISCTIETRGSSVTLDFAGTSAQTRGCVNAPFAVTLSAAMYTFRTLVGGDVPSNFGSMVPIRVVAPAGTVVNALPPAAVAAGNVETSQRIVDVLYGALAKIPGLKVPAASSGTMNNVSIGGTRPGSGQHFAYYETVAGGMGARPGLDGLSAVHTHMTNTMNTPLEVLEREYPVRMRRYAVRRNSGGGGRYRGGDGLVREIELIADCELSILSDRRRYAPYGLRGGSPGRKGRNVLVRGGRRRLLPSKASVSARKGDILTIETPGGGGFGKK